MRDRSVRDDGAVLGKDEHLLAGELNGARERTPEAAEHVLVLWWRDGRRPDYADAFVLFEPRKRVGG